MKDYQKRVIQEQKDLGEKIIKLITFLVNTTLINDLNKDEWDLLNYQLKDMLSYNQILQKRIFLFIN